MISATNLASATGELDNVYTLNLQTAQPVMMAMPAHNKIHANLDNALDSMKLFAKILMIATSQECATQLLENALMKNKLTVLNVMTATSAL